MMSITIFPSFDKATSTFTYVVWDSKTLDAVIIDPVWDFDLNDFSLSTKSASDVIAFIRSEKLIVHYILETHVHADHISSSQILKRACDGSKVAIGKNITKVQSTFKKLLSLQHLAVDG